ncbi:MAG TPA: hypothetical protein VJM32_01735 [Candidatus Saccharimonadales bacterium]|nr:hypothetical protein [Candidatus Saccharimonadales bacterium]
MSTTRSRLAVAGVALALAVISALTLLAQVGFFTAKPSVAAWDYTTNDATEAEMLASLEEAPANIAKILREDAAVSKDAMFIAAAKRVYVAKRDVAIAHVDTPMIIILSPDVRWTRGQLGNVVLLRLKEATLKGAEDGGFVFADTMCNAELVGLAHGVCMNIEAQRPGTWKEMLTHLRRPTEPELAKWLGESYIAGHANLYYVATSNFVAAPEYKFNDVPGETLGIFMPPGIKVLGGQLGYMDLYKLTSDGTRAETVTDSLCFMNDGPDIWSEGDQAGRPNYSKPSSFAPDVELKRVSGCKR